MSMGLPAYTSVGAGTLTSSAGSGTIRVTPNASTAIGDLVVVVCGSGGSSGTGNIFYDLGDGWLILSQYWNDTDFEGGCMAACIAPRAGSSGYAGLGQLNTGVPWCAQSHTFRIVPPGRFLLTGFGAETPTYATASSTALDAPAINQPYQQVIDLVGRSYNNAGTTTTVGNITNYTERFDTGNATGSHGIALNDRTAAITGAVQNASLTSALAVSKGWRLGHRAMIPIIGNTYAYRGRYGSARRIA